MQRKISLMASVVATAILSGCASSAQPSHTPIPQALLVAAERASQARLVHADLAARMHGTSANDIRRDEPDDGLPAFMRAEVRLNYDGPMMQVLERVANDIGYRVNEYAKPPSGLSWTPWVHLSGSKPLVDHIRELNSQVPWQLVLDHRNRRMIIDYSADGSLAAEVKSARANQNSSQSNRVNLPDTSGMERAADRAAQREMTARPAQPPVQAPTQAQVAPARNNTAPAGTWFAGVDGYDTREHARAMVDWLAVEGYESQIAARGSDGYEVRIYAGSNAAAAELKGKLQDIGVPTRIGMDTSDRVSQEAQRAMEASQPTEMRQPREITNLPPSSRHVSSSRGGYYRPAPDQAAPSDDQFKSRWHIQLLAGPNVSVLKSKAASLRSQGHEVFVKEIGRISALYSGPYESVGASRSELKGFRASGFPDAYLVAPKKG